MLEDYFHHFNILEILGAAFGVVQVLLSRKNNINNYLFGIDGILIGVWIYFQHKLYADILLNLYYLIMSIYGWFYWKFGKKHKETPITYSTKTDYITTFSICIICFAIMSYWLKFHTDSDVPIWDALVAAFAWGGMWLLAKRKIENWIFLNLSNIVVIPLLIYKGLYIYAGLSVFLFIMGISGYLNWKKIYNQERKNEFRTA